MLWSKDFIKLGTAGYYNQSLIWTIDDIITNTYKIK